MGTAIDQILCMQDTMMDVRHGDTGIDMSSLEIDPVLFYSSAHN